MNISVTTDTKANDRVIRGSSFIVKDNGLLQIFDGSEVAAMFAPGAWLSVVKDSRG